MLKKLLNLFVIGALVLFSIMSIQCDHGVFKPEAPESVDGFQGVLDISWKVYGILKPDHSLWLWGWNDLGSLGNGTTVSSETPVQVVLDYVVDFDMEQCHVTAVDSAGDVWYWGLYLLGGAGPMILEPAKISHIDQVIDIQWMGPEIFVLSEDGSIWKVHVNFYNAEGPTKWIEPEWISTIPGAIPITETIALLENGAVQSYQPLSIVNGGLPYPIEDIISIKTVPGFKTVLAKKDGTVWNWGLIVQPDKTYEKIATPEQVSGLADIVAVDLSNNAGTGGHVALSANGTIWFWGRYHPVPTRVVTGVSKMAIDYHSGSYEHILLEKKDGSYWVIPINYVEFSIGKSVPVIWD